MNPDGNAAAVPDRTAGRRAAAPDGAAHRVRALRAAATRASARSGMLRALLERGIVPDVVIGTSAGALNGAGRLLRAEPHRASRSSRRCGSSSAADHVFPGGQDPPGVERRAPRHAPLRERGPRGARSTTATPARSFSDLEIPLRVIATDLDTGEEVVLARGPLKPALLASAALPGRVPDRRTTTAAAWSTAASSTPCRCGTRSPGRSTASSC